jgi:hypothetical protein
MTANDTAPLEARGAAPVRETAGIGNRDGGLPNRTISSSTASAIYFGVRWDGDKVRGIRIDLSDGSTLKVGGFDDGNYTLTEYRFAVGETLKQAWLRDSGYGHRSVRQIEFVTSKGGHFKAGAGGFDNEVSLDVEGALLVGIHAWINPDNFINGLAFEVRREAPPKPPVKRPWFETKAVGNPAAGGRQVSQQAADSTALSIAVRWDGDKVRGLRMVLRNGTVIDAGGIDDTSYTLTSYTFGEHETLATLSMSSSG